MAQLPIRMGRSAQPQIGGPLSTPNTEAGEGLRQLGAGVANVGIQLKRIQTKEKKAEEAYEMKSAVLRATSALKSGAQLSRDKANTGQEADEKYEVISGEITKQFTAEMSGDQSKEFISRIEGAKIGFGEDVTSYGMSIDRKNKVDGFADTRNGMSNSVYEDPQSLDFLLKGFLNVTESFMESEGIPKQYHKEFNRETRNMFIMSAINGSIDGGRLGAEEALKYIDKYSEDLTVETATSLKRKANEVIRSAIARSQAIITEKVEIQKELEDENVPTTDNEGNGYTPEDAFNETIAGGGDVETAKLNAWRVEKNIIGGEVRRVYAQLPIAQLTARISALSDATSKAILEGGADIRAVGGAFQRQKAELDALKQLRSDMNGPKALETISKYSSSLRDQDASIRSLEAQLAESDDPAALTTLIVEAKGVRAKILFDLGMQIGNDGHKFPLADQDARSNVKTLLNNPQISAEDKAEAVTKLLLSSGIAAIPQVISTYFTDDDTQEWQYLANMALNDPAKGQRAIEAYYSYDENTKSNLYTDTTKGVVESATTTEPMNDFTSTFRGTNGSTASKAAMVIQRMTVADIARGADADASLTKNTKDVLPYTIVGIDYSEWHQPFDSTDRSQSFRIPNSLLNPHTDGGHPTGSLDSFAANTDPAQYYKLGQKAINSKVMNSVIREIWPKSFDGLDQKSFELLDFTLTNDDGGVGGYIDLNYDSFANDMGEVRHATRTMLDSTGKMVLNADGTPFQEEIVIPFAMIEEIGVLFEDLERDRFAASSFSGRSVNAPEHELTHIRGTLSKDDPVAQYLKKRDLLKDRVKWLLSEHYSDIDMARRVKQAGKGK